MVNLGLFSSDNAMKSITVTFRIPYNTQWGQSILVSGSVPVLGSGNVKRGLLLTPTHQGSELVWHGSVEVPSGFECEYSYYLVDDDKNVLRWEIGKKRNFLLPDSVQDGETVQLHDLWQTGSDALPFSSAFKDVIFGNASSLAIERPLGVLQNKLGLEDSLLVQFQISCPNLEKGTSVYVIGSPQILGQWKTEGALKLSYAGESIWQADCLIAKNDFPIKYRYGKYDKAGKFSTEIGSNRELSVDTLNSKARYVFLSDGMLREMPWRGAGMAIPMFSVRSENDLGVGEFLDLKLLVDWAVASGFHLVQLLPINDTSVHGMWWDSYPYSSLSVFALHPLYLRVQALSENIPEEIKQEIAKAKERLNLKDVDYEATMETKLSIAKKIFALEKDLMLKSSSFQKFFSENEEWLKPYAAFCFLRDFFETSDHSQWGRFSKCSKEKLEKLVSEDSPHYSIVCFHYYVQYHLHLQLSEASAYARVKGVILKGDLPIGVDRNSVDTWVYPNLFRMNTSTGAPPDYFDKNGQNWGFPTYNWEEMSKDNYGWWRGRLTQMAKYFTAYRIDHILGFFRIWELPEHSMTGLVGKFRPSIPLSQEELEKEGIWDLDRLSRPYIRKEFLQENFGNTWTVIASLFLDECDKEHYEFKEDCNTEKKIAANLKDYKEQSLLLGDEAELRIKLFDIQRNIVLIRDPEDARSFYPRFNLEDTTSFKDLDNHRLHFYKRFHEEEQKGNLLGFYVPQVYTSLFEFSHILDIYGVELPQYLKASSSVKDQNSIYMIFVRHMDRLSKGLMCKNVLRRLYYDYYFHRQENLWRQNALKTLPVLLNSSDMLACGEDLGLIPSCVHPVMQELGLIGLRIQRMPNESDLEFGIPSQYGYMTVCAPSCHDCSTLRAWWEEDEERRRRFFKSVVGSNKIPPSECVPEIAHFVIRQHVEAPSMWAIFPLQDLLALKEEYTARPAAEETINDPTNPKHYWRFRTHVTLESLLKDQELESTIKYLVRGSGRSCPAECEGTETASTGKQQPVLASKAVKSNGVSQSDAVAVL